MPTVRKIAPKLPVAGTYLPRTSVHMRVSYLQRRRRSTPSTHSFLPQQNVKREYANEGSRGSLLSSTKLSATACFKVSRACGIEPRLNLRDRLCRGRCRKSSNSGHTYKRNRRIVNHRPTSHVKLRFETSRAGLMCIRVMKSPPMMSRRRRRPQETLGAMRTSRPWLGL